jgi:hypothetical protein
MSFWILEVEGIAFFSPLKTYEAIVSRFDNLIVASTSSTTRDLVDSI